MSPSPIANPGNYPFVNTFSGDNNFGPCQADVDGLFGWGNKKEERIVKFSYELETKPGVAVDSMLVFTLQRHIMENTLPVLFPDQCRGDKGLNRDRERHLRNLLVVGVSAYPLDQISDCKFLLMHSFCVLSYCLKRPHLMTFRLVYLYCQ